MRRRAALAGGLLLLLGGTAGAAERDLPKILHVLVSDHLVAGYPGQARLSYHAPQANVVAVVLVLEDLDGVTRSTRQREINVIAAAFGLETGELVVPVGFATPGRKQVVFTLLTDEREESEPASVQVEVRP